MLCRWSGRGAPFRRRQKITRPQKERVLGWFYGSAFENCEDAVEEFDQPAEQAAVNMRAYREKQFDLLAKTVRASLDMEKVYAILKGE